MGEDMYNKTVEEDFATFETAVYRPGSYFSESVMSLTPLSHCLILFSPHASMAYSKPGGEVHLATTGI